MVEWSVVSGCRAAVEKGFAMASDALGGALPEISWETHDAVMEKLDAWAESV